MDLYLLLRTLHIVSATVLFGTGLGIAFFFFAAHRAPDAAARLFAARATVRADFLFTLPAVVLQPLTGIGLILLAGHDWTNFWLVASYALYLIVGLCWVPVVFIQITLRDLAARRAAGEAIDEARYDRLYRWWFALGWPAFIGLVAVFYLMVFKPGW
ncbi:MAG: DUF2269 domain-containing protein [Sphingomonadales bacterium]|nr:DUF2269 domain-containing protein [Sphingomonadales bacterium]